jgi:hypothetical protein
MFTAFVAPAMLTYCSPLGAMMASRRAITRIAPTHRSRRFRRWALFSMDINEHDGESWRRGESVYSPAMIGGDNHDDNVVSVKSVVAGRYADQPLRIGFVDDSDGFTAIHCSEPVNSPAPNASGRRWGHGVYRWLSREPLASTANHAIIAITAVV